MIQSYKDYLLYLEADRIALGRKKFTWKSLFFDSIWKWERMLRKIEYLANCKQTFWGNLYRRFLYIRWTRMRIGYEIPINTFGPGLSIAHKGTIIVNSKVRVGKNCRIHVDVVLGQGKDADDIPKLGDNIHIGPGVKIIGGCVIGNNTVIAANAVVTKSFPEGNCTIGGIPAHKISSNTSLTPSGNQGRGLLIQGYEEALKLLNI